MNRSTKTWCMIHSYVSMFFLPLALMYAITGGVLVLESREGQHGRMVQARNGSGPAGAHGYGGPGQATETPGMRGEGRERTVSHPPTKPSGLLGKLTLFHKAKGGGVAKIVGATFATAFLVMYCSGICVGWANKSWRKRMLLTAAAGLVVTIVVVAASS